MIENQNAGVTQKKKKYGRLKGFICFFVAAFISFSQVSPIWAAEGTRVFDEAGLFSAEEVQELETRIDEVRDSQDADLAVLTVEDAQGESAESYADDFYDTHGLGVGDDASGILLSIDMDNREIYVSTTGYAMKVLTDARVEKVLDAAYDSVADGNYAEGALGAIDSIENYLEIREFLQQKGVKFASQTDTEVVAQLMEYCMGLPEVETVSDALYMVLHRIEGAYALGILCSDDPDHVYAARKDAPLLIGFGEGENFIASDVTALVKHTRDIVYMEDGEVAILGRDGVQVYNAMELPIEKEHHHIDWEISAAEKGGYEHFMLKEIMEEPEALRRAILPRIKDGTVGFDGLMLDSSRYDCIKIIACGSSYHVGMVGKYNLEKLTRMPVEVILASEFRYCSPIVNERTLAIIISQSGETLDTMAALREAKSLGARILSIVNVVGSSIARESDDVLYTWAGPEIAVATTKAYSTQMAVLDLLAVYLAAQRKTISAEEAGRLRPLPRCLHRLSRFCPAASRSSITLRSISTTILCSLSAGIWTMRSVWRGP